MCLVINWQSCLCILSTNPTLAAILNLTNLPKNSAFLFLSLFFQVITSVVNSISIEEGEKHYYLHQLFQTMNSIVNLTFKKQGINNFSFFLKTFCLVINWQYCLCILIGNPTLVAILNLTTIPKVSVFLSLWNWE